MVISSIRIFTFQGEAFIMSSFFCLRETGTQTPSDFQQKK